MAYEDELDRMRERKQRRTGNRGQEENRRREEDTYGTGPQIMAGQDRIYQTPGGGRNPRAQYTGRQSGGQPDRQSDRQSDRQYSRVNSGQPDWQHGEPSDGRSGGKSSRMRQTPEEDRRKKKKKKKRRMLFLELLALILLLGGAYLLFGHKTHQKGYWTIAVFGVDSREGNLEKGALSDVEMVCSINKETGEIRLLSVYRDSYLKIDSKGNYHKINEAYFKGGHEQAIEALNDNLDLKIDDYATFNWKAVAQAINILGGVDIEITDAEFAYINGFITETVNSTGIGSHQLEHAGMNHLDGIQAVSYARLRLMDTDFNRTERQRKVVTLALEKAKQADFSTLKTLILTVIPQISTSIGVDDMIPLAKGVGDYHLGETAGFPFSRTTMRIGNLDCVIATTLESNVVQLHQFLYQTENYTPSQTVKNISAKISEVSGITEPGANAPSGGGSSAKKATKAPETAAPAVTEPETTTEAETEETPAETETAEETTEEETVEKPTDESGNLVGPGADVTKQEEENRETKSQETTKEAVVTEPETAPAKEPENQEPKEPVSEAHEPEEPAEGPGEGL